MASEGTRRLPSCNSMNKIVLLCLVFLAILVAVYPVNACAGDTGFPEWVQKLQSQMNQAFHIQAKTSSAREPDRIGPNTYFSICIQGGGYLEITPDPFEEMDKVFLSDGWKTNERYQADGHGSSSFAYERKNTFVLFQSELTLRATMKKWVMSRVNTGLPSIARKKIDIRHRKSSDGE